MPYPPGLIDPDLREDFAEDYIEYIRAVDLRLKFNRAASNITFSNSTLVTQATKAEIKRAKNTTISELAKHVWSVDYDYNLAGTLLTAGANFAVWLSGRAEELKKVMLEYSEDEEWREKLCSSRLSN